MTLAFAEMLRVVAVNTEGRRLVARARRAPSRELGARCMFVFAGKLPYYYVILAMALGALAITAAIERARLGYALAAIRENEDAAEAAGVDALGTKLRAMALSSFLTALGGTFYAQYFAYIDPDHHLRAGRVDPGAAAGDRGRRRAPCSARSSAPSCSRRSPS